MAQSVGRPTLAQVTISRSVSSSPALGSGLTAQSLEPVSDSVSSSLSLTLPRSCSVSLSVSKLKIKIKKIFLKKWLRWWDAWEAKSVKCPTSAQVMISRSVGLSPASGSVLTAQSLEPASYCGSPSLSL